MALSQSLSNLETIAQQLVYKGKGILAADESSPTIEKRFRAIDVTSTEENRRRYRQLLFTTDGLEEFISGVILFEETLMQTSNDGKPLANLLSEKGIIPGIKVDKGIVPITNFNEEKVTQGLDGLKQRLVQYAEAGAKFSKWRAVITIGDNKPSHFSIKANAHALARFAALSQEAGLVPIVEPEVLMDGDHTLEQCETATTETLVQVFAELHQHKIHLEGMLLKASMVLSGKDCPQQSSVEQVAEATIRTLRRTLPIAVPGVVFLSGGQTPVQATTHLNAMNSQCEHPWELSFSFGRALQEPVLKSWSGKEDNVAKAQQQLYARAQLNGAARFGKYSTG